MLARYCTESQKVRKERDWITQQVQLVAVTNLSVAVSVSRIGKFERYKCVTTWTKIMRPLFEHLICKDRSDERRQKLVQNDPLIMPAQLPGSFVEDVVVRYSGQPSVIDKRIVSFQHGEVQLRDQHVRVIAWVADNRRAFSVPLYVSSVLAKQELRRVMALVEERMAGRPVAIERFEVEFRTAGIV